MDTYIDILCYLVDKYNKSYLLYKLYISIPDKCVYLYKHTVYK